MNTLPRRAPRALQHSLRPTQRRLASDHSHGHADPAPAAESFGPSFWMAVGVLPVSFFVYNISRPSKNGEKNPVTRMLERYSDWKEEWTRRNDVHTRLVEQAGHDRNLFIHSPQPNYHELRMPEMFNAGSPVSVPAGHSVDLNHVMEHYRKKNTEHEAKKLRKLEERGRREGWQTEH